MKNILLYGLIPPVLSILMGHTTAFAITPQADAAEGQALMLSDASAERGRVLWTKITPGSPPFVERSCTSCHGKDLRQPGVQISTKKPIEPMAPSITPSRFTDREKVEKWFLRNCKWTFGRACTEQEKSDFLAFLITG